VKKPGVVFNSGMLSVEPASYRDVYGEDYRGGTEQELDARFLSLANTPEADQQEMREILLHFEKQAGVDFCSQEFTPAAFMYGMESDAYLYHVTTADRVDSIYDLGAISPDNSGQFEGAGPRANSNGRVFFTEKGGVRFWCDRIGEQLIHQGRVSEGEDEDDCLRVLSVRRDMIQKPQPDSALEITGAGRDWFTCHSVPIGGDVPLVTFDAQGRIVPPSKRFLPLLIEADVAALSGRGGSVSVSQGVSYER